MGILETKIWYKEHNKNMGVVKIRTKKDREKGTGRKQKVAKKKVC